jgi:hypothetical protein
MVLEAPCGALRWCAAHPFIHPFIHPLFFNLLEFPDAA